MSEEKKQPQENDRNGQEQGFEGISRERMLELIRHVAEIQRYQKAHGLEDKGDPPEEKKR